MTSGTGLRRDRRIAARHERARQRRRAMMMATLAVAASTVVGVGAAGGTFALLTANAELPGATVRAGTLTLTINDGDQAALGAWNLGPTVAQAKPFTITNTGTVATSINASGVVTSTTPLGAYVNARITRRQTPRL